MYLGCTINHRIISLCYAFNLLVQGPFLFAGISIGEEVDGVGDRGSGATTTVDVHS